MNFLFMFLLLLLAFFLIVLILIQRGKGGGLAGALGGMGGQSAFGTKAGDLFTRITIGVAVVWIVVCIVSVWTIGRSSSLLNVAKPTGATTNSTAPGTPGAPAPVGGGNAGGGNAGGPSGATKAGQTPAPTQSTAPAQKTPAK